MPRVTNLLMGSALALPLSLGAIPAHAADLVETIRDTAQLETFARALEQAGMAETLRGEGPITVFAPTDAASGRPSSPHRPATSHRSTV